MIYVKSFKPKDLIDPLYVDSGEVVENESQPEEPKMFAINKASKNKPKDIVITDFEHKELKDVLESVSSKIYDEFYSANLTRDSVICIKVTIETPRKGIVSMWYKEMPLSYK